METFRLGPAVVMRFIQRLVDTAHSGFILYNIIPKYPRYGFRETKTVYDIIVFVFYFCFFFFM